VPPTERTLTTRALNRALLARQQLIQPSTAPIPKVLEQMGGLQAQYAPAMYLGLWSRMARLERATVTEHLHQRQIIQATLLRSTIHLVSKADYWPMVLAVRQARRDSFLRAVKPKPDADQLAGIAARVRLSLQDGPVKQTELYRLAETHLRNGIGLWLDLVRVPPSGTWERRRADPSGLAEEWVGPAKGTAAEGLQLLVRRYLGGFGPARRTEIADWAGVPVTVLAPILDQLNLRRFRAEDGAVLLDLPRAPLPDPETPVPVRFLPTWDATLLVHARRTLVLPEEYRPRIFHVRAPHSFNAFLVDGSVAGTWRFEGGRVRLEEFAPLDKAVRRELAEEAERLAAFHG
jgi:DNA glycosylase AlkZ-like